MDFQSYNVTQCDRCSLVTLTIAIRYAIYISNFFIYNTPSLSLVTLQVHSSAYTYVKLTVPILMLNLLYEHWNYIHYTLT